MLNKVIVSMLTFGLFACEPKLSPEEEWKLVVGQVPWILEMLEYCETYKGTESDNDKATIARGGRNFLQTVSVAGAEGKVDKVMALNANELMIQIKMGDRVRFSSQSKDRPITRESPVFSVVDKLRKGDCVQFSGKDIAPISNGQLGRLCDPRYYLEFTSLQPCP